MQDKIFYAAGFGFLFGVFLRSFIWIDFYLAVLLAVISLAIFFLFLIFNPPERLASFSRAGNKWGVIIAIFVLTFSFGILRFSAADKPAPLALESKVGEKIILSGILLDEPSIRENNQHLVVELPETKMLLISGLEGDYKYGDEIKFTGVLKKPENFETEQGKLFDYVNYLRKDGIFYTIIYPDTEIISRCHGNPIKRGLFFTKNKFLEKINFAIAAPESLLMGGLILGERATFSEKLRQDFITTGTIHIVALSGYNVTIVAEWFMKLLAFLPKTFGFGAGIFSIFLFVLMTGANATAVRAGLMASLALVARATGRNYDVARALLLAAVGMVFFNPFILAYDVSFQLSMLATVAVIFLAPRFEKYFFWVTKNFGLRDIFSITTAAYLFVFPFILYQMGNFSLVALPANILVLPFIPATMAAGFLTGLAGLLWSGLAVPFGFISYLFLHYELGVIGLLADFPFASFSFPYFPFTLTLAIYAYFIYFLFWGNIKNFLTANE